MNRLCEFVGGPLDGLTTSNLAVMEGATPPAYLFCNYGKPTRSFYQAREMSGEPLKLYFVRYVVVEDARR